MPPNQDEHQYDFITEGKKSDSGFLTSASTGQRVILVSAGLILLVVIFMVISSFLSRGGEDHRNNLIRVAQTQAELIRVAQLGERESSSIDSDLQAETIMIYQTIQTDLNETNQLLSNSGIDLSNSELGGLEDPETDEAIEQSISSNQLPSVLRETLDTQLRNYQSALRRAYSTGTPLEREVLEQNFEEVSLLLKRSN